MKKTKKILKIPLITFLLFMIFSSNIAFAVTVDYDPLRDIVQMNANAIKAVGPTVTKYVQTATVNPSAKPAGGETIKDPGSTSELNSWINDLFKVMGSVLVLAAVVTQKKEQSP